MSIPTNIYNLGVLENFLQMDPRKNPQLAVYRNQTFVILTNKFDGVLGTIRQLAYRVLQKIGFISTDPTRIKTLREEAESYCFNQAETTYIKQTTQLKEDKSSVEKDIEKAKSELEQTNQQLAALQQEHELAKIAISQKQDAEAMKKKLDEDIRKLIVQQQELTLLLTQKDQLQGQKEALEVEVPKLNEKAAEAKSKLDEVTQQLKIIAEQYEQAKKAIAEKDAAQEKTTRLEQAQMTILLNIENLEKKQKQLADVESRLSKLDGAIAKKKEELKALQQDINQNDFKAKNKVLKEAVGSLERANQNLEQDNQNKDQKVRTLQGRISRISEMLRALMRDYPSLYTGNAKDAVTGILNVANGHGYY